MSTILEDLSWRYATKQFDRSKKLSQEKIEVLKNAFNLTATSFGLQPVRLLVISDQELKDTLVQHSMGQKQVGDASHLLVFCIEKKVDTTYVKTYFDRVKAIRNTEEEILQPFQEYLMGHFKNKESTEVDLWAAKQAYLAMGNLLTVCAIEKIDACPMEGFDPFQYDAVLGLKEKSLQSVLVMPVGYRSQEDFFSELKKVRKPLSDAVIEM